MINKKIIHFGAGNIGRGLIGQLAKENNVAVVFVDVVEKIIAQINNKQNYEISLLPSGKKINITNIQALNFFLDKEKIMDEIVKSNMITTSIGVNKLLNLAEIINLGLKKRKSRKKISIACFENGFQASKFLYDEILKLNPENNQKLNFVNVVVDLLVPNQLGYKLDLSVEDFYSVWYQKQNSQTTWLFEKSSIEIKNNYRDFFWKKFYGVNGFHFAVALIGFAHDKKYISQTINDFECSKLIENLIEEICLPIANLTNHQKSEIKMYLKENVRRFSNPYLLDEITRVCRDAKNKLSQNERFMPIYNWAKKHNLTTKTLDYVLEIAQKYIKRGN